MAKTQSSAQILVLGGDTLSCYTSKELDIIGSRIKDAKECDTTLSIVRLQLEEERSQSAYLYAQVQEYESIRLNDQNIVKQKDYLIEARDKEITSLSKEVRKQKVLKVLGTGLFAITTIIFIVL